jgi:hypothetical protein
MEKLSSKKMTWGVATIAVVIIGVSVSTFYLNQKAANEETLIYQLKQLRTGFQISLKLNGKMPESLESMVDTPFQVGNKIDWKIDRNATGQLIDSFGNPFIFDKQRGWVSSSTQGYENW